MSEAKSEFVRVQKYELKEPLSEKGKVKHGEWNKEGSKDKVGGLISVRREYAEKANAHNQKFYYKIDEKATKEAEKERAENYEQKRVVKKENKMSVAELLKAIVPQPKEGK